MTEGQRLGLHSTAKVDRLYISTGASPTPSEEEPMSNKPSIEEFMNADFTIVASKRIGRNPQIAVENGIAPVPFYYEVTVEEFADLNREALWSDEAPDDYVNRALEIEVTLSEEYGVSL